MNSDKELLRIVEAISKPQGLSDDALEKLVNEFVDSIPHPGGTDLLFYPEYWGLSSNPSREDIVKEALSWQPRVLAMRVTEVSPHPKRKELFCYGVEVPGKILTQVISSLTLKVGDVCAVALSGTILPNGKKVRHGFFARAYSAGEILGVTEKSPGVELSPDDFQ